MNSKHIEIFRFNKFIQDSIVEIEKGKEDSLNMDVFANSCIFRSKDKDEIEQWMDSINNCINVRYNRLFIL